MSDVFVGSVGKENTIHRDETDFDDSFKIDIDFAKMEFGESLNFSEASSIFHANYSGKPLVLKVFHNNGDVYQIWTALAARSELIAVLNGPKYAMRAKVGFVLAIDPANCAPRLDAFQHDTGLPHAILIE
ncbi:hypothetical protein PRK78_007374 [Emydomyces testavorans]|uniref:Uncharacterized protein n=1 Tax=Emydomyces testavorans TaxID=2070801 RepID=A0AAF0DNL1_9EURO|nr:hypothetical protein PRK78_007374 [Emydomyces testavorans]